MRLPIDGLAEQSGIVLISQWNEFCRLRTEVLGHLDTDSIHDLRVASRRMRAMLGLFLPFIAAKPVKTLSKEIRRITRALGHVRNIDEAIIYFNASSVHLPVLTGGLCRIRKKEVRAVTRILKAFPCRDMDRSLRKAVAKLVGRRPGDGNEERLSTHLSETSAQRYQSLHALLVPAAIPENVEMRHRLRIAIKKWRYLLETIGQVCGQDYGDTLELLKEYQTVLGSLNDMVEFGLLSARLALPEEELHEMKNALERDTARYIARFAEIASSRPIEYTDLL